MPFSEKTEWQILTLREKGATYPQIAKKLGLSHWAVARHCLGNGLGTEAMKGHLVTGKEVAREWLRCATPKALRYWRKRRWLVPHIAGRYHRYRRDQFAAFIENEATWHTWRPEDVIPDDLREHARALRASADYEWLTLKEAGARVSVHPSVFPNRYIPSGMVPATRYLNKWMVRSDHLDEWAAQHFAEPEQMEEHSAYMPSSYWRFVLEFGDGNMSAGIREIVARAMQEAQEG